MDLTLVLLLLLVILIPLIGPMRAWKLRKIYPSSSKLITVSALVWFGSILTLEAWFVLLLNLPVAEGGHVTLSLSLFAVWPVALGIALLAGSVLSYFDLRERLKGYRSRRGQEKQ
jgi:nitrate reductase gamma subunit